MTFLDPAHPLPRTGSVASHLGRFRRVAIAPERRRAGDEDCARKALGHDPIAAAFPAGASLEDVARIAFG